MPTKRYIDIFETKVRPEKHGPAASEQARMKTEAVKASRELREAENVVSSYTAEFDFLAEALQNSADAIDAHTEIDSSAPRRIQVRFDRKTRRFSVGDTGIGMSVSDLDIVLRPSISLKSGKQAKSRRGRSRGEKGVGLSFLALASNYLEIRTCDGRVRQDLKLEGASNWVRGGGKVPKPLASVVEGPADEFQGSARYTVITVGDITPALFEGDLFDKNEAAIRWSLRTRTAVGNTAHLFDGLEYGERRDDDIDVELIYVSPDGKKRSGSVDYRYATPEELVPGASVVAFEDVEHLPIADRAELLRGKAVRYVQEWKTPTHVVDVYCFAMDGREMAIYEKAAGESSGARFFPREWQGVYLATRNMPTGVPIPDTGISPRTYERRMFVLMHDDELKLDLGRKTLAGRTKPMLKNVLSAAWREDLDKVVPVLRPSSRVELDGDKEAIKAMANLAKKDPNLEANVPYLKVPRKRSGVAAVFHELMASPSSPFPEMHTLSTGVFSTDDELIYPGSPNGALPLHYVFGRDLDEIVEGLERDEKQASTVDVGVVWSATSKRGYEAAEERDNQRGATHRLELHGRAGRDSLQLVVLQTIVGTGSDDD